MSVTGADAGAVAPPAAAAAAAADPGDCEGVAAADDGCPPLAARHDCPDSQLAPDRDQCRPCRWAPGS